MWNSRGKVPEIAFRDVSDEALAVRINRCDPRVSVQHNRPLRRRVPVQLSYASCRQSHVHAGNRLGNRKLPDRNLARPSTLLHPFVGESERVLERLYAACVGGRRQERVWILGIQRGIAWTRSTRALIPRKPRREYMSFFASSLMSFSSGQKLKETFRY